MDSYKQTVSSLGFRVGRVRVEHWQMYPGRGQLISAPLSACSFSFSFFLFSSFHFSPFLSCSFSPRAIATNAMPLPPSRKGREKHAKKRGFGAVGCRCALLGRGDRYTGTRRWRSTRLAWGARAKKKRKKRKKGQPLRAHLRFPSVLQCPAVSGERRCQMCFPIRIHPNHLQEQCRGQGCAALLSSPRPPG